MRCAGLLFGTYGLERDAFLGILATTGGASAVEILLDMMPAESTDLYRACVESW